MARVFSSINALFELFSIEAFLLSGALIVLGWWAVLDWTSPLRVYPGPFLASRHFKRHHPPRLMSLVSLTEVPQDALTGGGCGK